MRTLFLLVSLLSFQGCTLLGAALDEKLGIKNKKNRRGETLTELGTQADIELLNNTVTGKPLPTHKKPKKCSDLKGLKKTECDKTIKQLNVSINKHTKN